MKLKRIVLAGLGLVLGAAVLACFGGPSVVGPDLEVSIVPEEVEIEGKGLVVEDYRVESGFLFTYIIGTIANNSNVEYDFVYIEFNLYDETGALVDNAGDGIDNFEAHSKWEFEVMVWEDRAAKAKLKSIHGHRY
jgi:hypothetical protein